MRVGEGTHPSFVLLRCVLVLLLLLLPATPLLLMLCELLLLYSTGVEFGDVSTFITPKCGACIRFPVQPNYRIFADFFVTSNEHFLDSYNDLNSIIQLFNIEHNNTIVSSRFVG
uniref:Uncharacterized protein n=1 Tax=Glossina brevipalpis TaxID=37001 RepID=A0A1A9W767_9MUSC